MKREGRLIERIVDQSNLELAFYRAKKGQTAKQCVLKYEKKLQYHLTDLRKQILSGKPEIGNYYFFTINDPKKRVICAAPFEQRVLHHALMNVCHPVFEKVQIFDSYASRIDKGTYAALARARYFSKSRDWFLKLDYKKYFDSLDHSILKSQLSKIFKDKGLLNIFEIIIDSYSVNRNKGVPIGNLTSQYFANHYLSSLDHYVKEKLQIKAYVRYMDDIVLWHEDKKSLLDVGQHLKHYSRSEIDLTLKPFCLNKTSFGIPFLGYLVYPDNIRLGHRSRSRFIKKLNIYENNLKEEIWTQNEYQMHVLPLISFTEHANAKEFRKKIISNIMKTDNRSSRGFEPRDTWRELEQQCAELPVGEPEQLQP